MVKANSIEELSNKYMYISFDHKEDNDHILGHLVTRCGEYDNKHNWLDIREIIFHYIVDGDGLRDSDSDKPSVFTKSEFEDINKVPKATINIVDEEELPKLIESLELLYGKEDDQRTKNPSIC